MDQESKKKPSHAKLRTVPCKHCGMNSTVRIPTKPGRYKFTCPNCSEKVSFEVNAIAGGERKVLKSDILDDRVISRRLPKENKPATPHSADVGVRNVVASSPSSAPKKMAYSIPVLGTPKPSAGKEKQYYVVEKAQVNKQYRIVCPECGKYLVIMPRLADKYIKVKCSICGSQVLYKSVLSVQAPQDALATIESPANKVKVTPPPLTPVVGKKPELRQVPPPVNPPQAMPMQPQAQQGNDEGQPTVILPGVVGGISDNRRNNPAPNPPNGQNPPPLPRTHHGSNSGTPPLGNAGAALGGDVSNIITWKDPKGMLCWKSGSLMRRTKSFRLLRGINTIGRYDPEMPSTVMISGDDEMSRQSVEINVVRKQQCLDYVYELRVLRSTNIVLVNGRQVGCGLTVQLNYGDTICMGRTTISFVKDPEDRR